MRLNRILFLMVLINMNLFAQVDLTAGMGISFVNNSSLQDYINSSFPSADELGTFNSALDLYAEADYSINEKYQIGIEYDYSLYSYTTSYGGLGQYEMNIIHHKPSVLGYYVVSGYGYKFKFGGGVGLRLIDLDEKIGLIKNYSSTGWGLVLKAQGYTALSQSVFANIGVTARYDLAGEPESKGRKIINNSLNQPMNINSLSFGVNLGISYFF
ncbi:MAG: hypothetical protein CO129_11905 [Ignavibacteriales bacterium CG_4_9_14_3_um_filter_34_10]|nr:MAG: hypothetical protein CO129_11905 [Ignavibacteriales bacterium CG_4_9_14_3_um_filter_34_10]